MKTLIFNGSPRENGDTAALLGAFLKNLEGETMLVSAYYGGIGPCVDCRRCWERPGCAIDDPMQDVYAYLTQCHNVVIASPVYFSQLTGPLLSVASRLQTYYAARTFRGQAVNLPPKNGALLLSGGGDGSPDMAAATALMLLRLMNARLTAQAASLGTNQLAAKDDSAALKQAAQAAQALNDLHRYS